MPPTKKSLGQHWLNDATSLEAIAAAAELSDTDTVLEIGPGPGALTKLLVHKAKHVVAIELDDNLAAQLPQTVQAANLEVVNADILHYDLGQLPADYKVVANIPYYLTSHLLRILSEASSPPTTMVLLIQKEVAERVAAQPGAMSILSVSVQLYYSVELGPIISADKFVPPPKVDSQVLILKRLEQSLVPAEEVKAFLQVVKAGFAARRKTLLNSLAGGLREEKSVVEAALQTANLQPQQRPQELSLQQWFDLYKALHK